MKIHLYIQMNNEKKSTQTILSERHQSWKKNIYIQRNGLTKKEENER